MHPQSPILTIGGTVLKESDDFVILGVTFDCKLTFEKRFWMVSRSASQRLGILRKSCRVFHDRSLLERCFQRFVLPILECCSSVWCSAADTHLKLLDREVSCARFLTEVCFSVPLLIVDPLQFCVCCIRSGVIRCTRLMMQYLDRMCQCGRCRTSQYHRTFVPLSVSLSNDLSDPVFDGVGLAGLKSRANAFLLA